MKMSMQELAIFTGCDDTLARDADATWFAHYVARHVLRMTWNVFRRNLLLTHLHMSPAFCLSVCLSGSRGNSTSDILQFCIVE